MHYTVFDTPVVRPVFRWISRMSLKAAGWKVVGKPRDPKYVIVAQRRSGWDFPIGLFMAFALGVKIYWIKERFTVQEAWLSHALAGHTGQPRVLAQHGLRTIEAFQEHESLGIAITPEGTREAPTGKPGSTTLPWGRAFPSSWPFSTTGSRREASGR